MARKNVSAEEFVRVVKEVNEAGGRIADIAERTGLKIGSVSTRISNLRKKGVNIPAFKRGGGGGRKTDVESLNAILAG